MFQNTENIVLRVIKQDSVMSKLTLIDILERWFDEVNSDSLNVTISGDEPMNVNINTFSAYLKILYSKAREYNINKLSCTVETNTVVINKKWLALFEKYKIKVIVNYNGFTDSGKLSNLLYFNGFNFISYVNMLVDSGNHLTVLDDIEILYNLGFLDFKINYSYENKLSDDELYDFSVKLIQLIIKYPNLNELNISAKILSYFNKNNDSIDFERNKLYNKNFNSTGNKIIEIEPNGDLFYFSSDSIPGINIYTSDTLELNAILKQFDYNKEKIDIFSNNKCSVCQAKYFCYSSRKLDDLETTYCSCNKKLADYFHKNSDTLYNYIKQLRNR